MCAEADGPRGAGQRQALPRGQRFPPGRGVGQGPGFAAPWRASQCRGPSGRHAPSDLSHFAFRQKVRRRPAPFTSGQREGPGHQGREVALRSSQRHLGVIGDGAWATAGEGHKPSLPGQLECQGVQASSPGQEFSASQAPFRGRVLMYVERFVELPFNLIYCPGARRFSVAFLI